MGNSDSRAVFSERLGKALGNVDGDADIDWDMFFLSDLSAEDVFEILSPEDVRRLAGQLAVAKLAAPTPFLGST
jgi:hypothetical protein